MQTINLSKLANHIQAFQNPSISIEWKDRHEESINEICSVLPHGSGIDGKCEISLELCKKDRIVFYVEFHHMDENGYYAGWTEHNIILTPSFIFGFEMRITGRNNNDIKEYLHQIFSEVFSLNTNTCPVS
jgi:hypothetical protein